MHATNCLNCGVNLTADQSFCSQCGQKTSIHRINFHELLHDVVHYFTHADKGIFHLLKILFTKPGVVAREYVRGARKKYFPPLNFFLIVAGIVVLMTTFFYKEEDEPRARSLERYAYTLKDQGRQKYFLTMAGRMRTATKFMSRYSNAIGMIATPLITVFFWLCYRRKYNYVEHLVANMYFVGATLLVYGLIIVPIMSLPMSTIVSYRILGVYFLFEIFYRSIAYYQFIDRKGALAFLKAFVISALVVAFWVAATWYAIVYYIQNGF